MKLIDIIVTVVTLFVLIDGFESEFSNPTLFDLFKWISCIIMIICYLVYKKKGDHNGF